MLIMQRTSKGFSLLEVMVVVFLIATIATVGLLKLGSGQNVAMESEAKQFVDKLNLLIDESIITGYSHRVIFEQSDNENSYIFQQLQSNEGKDLDVQPYLKRDVAPGLALLFSSFDQEREGIVISSDGSVNAFELRFGEKDKRNNRLLNEKAHWLVSFEENSYGDKELSAKLVSGD